MIDFTPIPGTTGTYSDQGQYLTITVPMDKAKELEDRLTSINKSIGFRRSQILKSLGFLKQKINGRNEYDIRCAMKKLSDELGELNEQEIKTYYEKQEDGSYIAPPGVWYLCERIEGNKHLTGYEYKQLIPILRPYQTDGSKLMLQYKRCTGVFATGLGKSLIISEVCAHLVFHGKRVCVVVPTDELVKQTMETIVKYIDSVTGAGGNRRTEYGKQILVTTAASAIKFIEQYHAVIIDESQYSSAKTWESLMLAAINADSIYNFTATPFRADGQDLGIHVFGGPTVYSRDAAWGVANGYLSPLKVFAVEITPLTDKGLPVKLKPDCHAATAYKAMSENKHVLKYIVNQAVRAANTGKKVVVLFKTNRAAFTAKKYMESITDTPCAVATQKSKKAIKDFKDGKVKVLFSNDKLLGVGINIPDLDILFNVLQNKSETTTFQVTGRTLRQAPGKKEGVIVDIYTVGHNPFKTARKARLAVYQRITRDITMLRA